MAINRAGIGLVIGLLVAVSLSVAAAILTMQDQFSRLNGPLWALALFVTLALGVLADWPYRRQIRWSLTVSDVMIMLFVTAVALGLRLYQLNEYFPPMHGDEGEMAELALLARHGPSSGLSPWPLPYFGTAFLDHPTLFHYLQAAVFALFGESLVALRILSAVTGALCVPLIYLLGIIGWGRIAGTSAAWLFAVSHLYIQYSRIALNNIQSIFCMILGILVVLWIGSRVQRNRFGDAAVAGATAERPLLTPFIFLGFLVGVAQYLYFGSRLMIVVIPVALIWLWWRGRMRWWHGALVAVAFFITYMPQVARYVVHPDSFISRARTVSALSQPGIEHVLGESARWPADIFELLWYQVWRNLGFFYRYGDISSFYYPEVPGFDGLSAGLIVLGVVTGLMFIRRLPEGVLLFWAITGFVLAGVLTIDSPNAPRLIVSLVALLILAGAALERVITNPFVRKRLMLRRTAVVVSVTIGACILVNNFTTYFTIYKNHRPGMTPITAAMELYRVGPNYDSYLMASPYFFVVLGTVRFIARGIEKQDLTTATDFFADQRRREPGRGAFIVVLPWHDNEFKKIRDVFPQGAYLAFVGPQGEPLAVTYKIEAEALDAWRADGARDDSA